MELTVVTDNGTTARTISLPEGVFNAPLNNALVAQAVRVRLTNARAYTAAVKTRSEVSGGGKKPWRQKGTGRARQGSIRAPQWKGGGVVHGPMPGKRLLSMPQSMRRAALSVTLTEKVQAGQLVIVDSLPGGSGKTKDVATFFTGLKLDRNVLVLTSASDEAFVRASANVPFVRTLPVRVVHAYDVIRAYTIVMTEQALRALETQVVSPSSPSEATIVAEEAAHA